MRRNLFTAMTMAALSAAVLPAAASPQTPQPERGRMGARQHMGQPGEPRVGRILELREELGLSADQVSRIERIRTELEAANAPLREQLSAARGQLHAARPGQPSDQRERRNVMRDSMRTRAQQMTPAQRDSMRTRAQQMTPAQRDSMRARRSEMRDGMRERADRMAPGSMLRPGRRAPADMPEELRVAAEQMRANTQRAAEQIHSVLTPGQAEKLRQLRGPATRPGAR